VLSTTKKAVAHTDEPPSWACARTQGLRDALLADSDAAGRDTATPTHGALSVIPAVHYERRIGRGTASP
jgi:hypothetical protein